MVVGERDPEHIRVEQIPRAARLHGRPPALLDAHEAALLEKLQGLTNDRPAEAELLAERGSVGSTSPSAKAPPMIRWLSSSTTTAAKRAGRH